MRTRTRSGGLRTPRWLPFGMAAAVCLGGGGFWWAATGEDRVAVAATPHGDGARCADVLRKLPRELMGEERRPTDHAGTAAWGDGGEVLLRCGLPPAAPSPDPCVRLRGVDWVVDRALADQGIWEAVTYGTKPAVQVRFAAPDASGTAWSDVTGALTPLRRTGHRCLDTADVPLPPPAG